MNFCLLFLATIVSLKASNMSQEMDKIFAFVSEHLFLVSLFAVTFIMLLVEEFRVKGALDPSEVAVLLQKKGKVYDIREQADFDSSSIEHSIHVKNLDKAKWEKWHSEGTIVLLCQDGLQSKEKTKELNDAGLKNVYFIEGGLNAWKKDGFHVVKSGQ